MKKRFNWKHIYKQYGTQITMAAVLIVLCIALTIASPYFLKKSNILNIFVSFSVSGTMAAGLTVVMLMGCMDLSQYSAMALIGMVVALALQAGLNAWLAILLGIILGTGIGAINAFIVTKMHIVPMIATISTQLMCRAGAYLVNNGQYVRVTNKLFDTIGFGRLFGVNYLIYIVLVVFLVIGYVLKNTTFGRKVYAVGGNQQSAALMGLNVKKTRMLSHVLCSFYATLGGLCFCLNTMCGTPTQATGLEMDAISSAVIGGTLLTGGVGNVVGTLFGVLINGTISSLVKFNGKLVASWANIITAVLLCFFILLQAIFAKLKERQK